MGLQGNPGSDDRTRAWSIRWRSVTLLALAALVGGVATHLAEVAVERSWDRQGPEQELRATSILLSALLADDPLVAALLMGELQGSPEPPKGFRLAHEIATTAIPLGRYRAGSPIFAVTFSPDNSKIFTGHADGSVWIWPVDGRGGPRLLGTHPRTEPRPGFRHTLNGVMRAVFSPDGSVIATAGVDGTARIWDVAGDTPPIVLEHEAPVGWVDFDADGSRVITASDDGVVRVWRADGSGEPQQFPSGEDHVDWAGFSPDGKFIAASSPWAYVVWRADGATPRRVFRRDQGSHNGRHFIERTRFSPDSNRIVAIFQVDGAEIRSLDGSEDLIVIPGGSEPVLDVVFGTSGNYLVARPAALELFRIKTSGPRMVGTYSLSRWGDPLAEPFRGGAKFSPQARRVLVARTDGTLKVWNTEGAATSHPSQHSYLRIRDLAWPTITLEGAEGSLPRQLWGGENFDLYPEGMQSSEGASFSADSSLLVTWDLRSFRVWASDVTYPTILVGESGRDIVGTTSLGFGEARGVEASPSDDGEVVVGLSDDAVLIWRPAAGRLPEVRRRPQEKPVGVSINAEGNRLTSKNDDGTIRISAVSNPGASIVFRHYEDKSAAFTAVSPDGLLAATVPWGETAPLSESDGKEPPTVGQTVHIWDPRSNTLVSSLEDTSGPLRYFMFDDHSEYVLTAAAGTSVRVWRLESPSRPYAAVEHVDDLARAAFGSDGQRVALGGGSGTVAVWGLEDPADPEILARASSSPVTSIEFSQDGSHLAAGFADGTARLWSLDERKEVAEIDDLANSVRTIRFVGNTNNLVIGTGSSFWVEGGIYPAVYIWNPDLAEEPVMLDGQASPRLTPDGRLLVTSAGDGAQLWCPSWSAVLDHLRSATTACLTAAERQTWLAESPELAWSTYAACERQYGRTPDERRD